ncbi:MAG: LamG domain-containing protein, partial [Pyrinomonadaceae bacterium]
MTTNTTKKAQYETVWKNIAYQGIPSYSGASIRGQLRDNPVNSSTYWWNWQWNQFSRPGSDVSHGGNVIAFMIESYDLGAYWTSTDMTKMVSLMKNVIWDTTSCPGYVDNSGSAPCWFNDGWAHLGRYDSALQTKLETHNYAQKTTFFGAGAYNAKVLLGGGTPPPAPPPPPAGGLVAHWKLDETSGTTASDSSGNSLTGTVTNATWTAGKINTALSLTGTTAYATMGDPALLDFGTGNFTLSGWFYMNALPNAWKSIINKGASGAVGYGLEINSSNQLCGSIQGTGGTNQHACYGAPSAGAWHHASAVFTRNDKIYVYLDGVLLGSQTYSAGNTGSVDNSNSFIVGSYRSSSWYVNGKIDAVRVYNRALTASEITALYSADTTPPPPPPPPPT